MSRQKLIHLHGKTRLADVNKLNFGEIAVRNGSSATETELAVLTNINGAKGEVVYIPSLATVTGLTNAVDVKVTAANTAIKELQDAVGLGENTSGETLTDRVGGLEDILNGKEGEVGLVGKVSANTAAISANTEAINTKVDVTAHTASYSAIDTRVTTVENAINDATTGLTKEVTDLKAWQTNSGATKTYAEEKANDALNSATANTESVRSDLQGKIDAANGRIDGLVTSAATFVTKERLEGLDFNSGTTASIVRAEGDSMTTAATITVGAEQVDGMITKVTVETTGLATEADINALTGKTGALGAKVDTLIGTDTGKSVRTIANEELAAQLILSDAAESLDSLQEIAQWIQDHPEDAAAMNKQIADIENVLDGYMTKNESGEVTISTVKADITGLTASINAVDTIAKAAVKEVKTSGITGVVVNTVDNVATIDFSLMTIDCGTYDEADE